MPDLLYRLGDNIWTVTGLKTGQEDPDWEQIGVYALYVSQVHGVQASSIVGRFEWLATGNSEDHQFSEDELETTRGRILDSMASMRAYLTDSDANRPRDKEDFPLRQELSNCKSCKFYELDREEIASRARGPF